MAAGGRAGDRNEEIAQLTSVSRSRTDGASRVVTGTNALLTARTIVFCCCATARGASQTGCNDASSGRWLRRWRHLMTDHDRARSPRSRRKPRLGGVSGAAKAREHGYPHKLWTTRFWHAMRAARTAGGHESSPTWCRHSVQIFGKRTSSRTKCATTWKTATPSSSRRCGGLCVYRESRS